MNCIGFVIIAWNSANYIKECLNSIIELDHEEFLSRIVVVDNGSSDETVNYVTEIFDANSDNPHVNCTLTKLEKNYGTTYSRNLGINTLLSVGNEPDFICVLDSDTEINSDAFLVMCEHLINDPMIGIIGPRMHNREMIYQVSGRNIATIAEKVFKVLPIKSLQEKGEKMQASIPETGVGCTEVGYLMSACWLMRTEVVKEIGDLDEKIFYSPEDLDYCIRCWKAGYKVVYCYDADIVHLWQRISRQKLFSKHNYEHIKGLAYMFKKHHYAFSTAKLWESIGAAVQQRADRSAD